MLNEKFMKDPKILFLIHPFPNFVPDLLLHGLRKLFGTNVIEYPVKESLYKGQLTCIVSEDELCQNLFDISAESFDRENIERKINLGYFDYIFCDLRALDNFYQMNLILPEKFIIVEGEDFPYYKIKPNNGVILRRETDGTDYSIPLQMALPEEVLQQIIKYDGVEKKYSMGFLGSVDSLCVERREMVEELASFYTDSLFQTTSYPSDDNISPQGRFGKEDYYKAMQSCNIVLNFRGAGLDTFRYWENSACNSIHLSQRLNLLIPNDFEEEKHIFKFKNISELKRKIDYILEIKSEWNEIKYLSREHLLNYHLTDKRALYIMNKLYEIYE